MGILNGRRRRRCYVYGAEDRDGRCSSKMTCPRVLTLELVARRRLWIFLDVDAFPSTCSGQHNAIQARMSLIYISLLFRQLLILQVL